jgi:mannose-6-phosphate isomerase-like protein (cupin superfamily)
LLVLEGEVLAEIEGESQTMKKFDVVVIPPGKKHKFTNQSRNPVLTFNTYSPPEY